MIVNLKHQADKIWSGLPSLTRQPLRRCEAPLE